MGAADQPRDSWGRYAPRPGGRAAAPTKPTAAPLFKEGKREVHLTKERTPHFQVWDGDEMVSEKPASRSWKRDQDEAIALAKGVPRDTSNFTALSDKGQNAVINQILRGGRAQPGQQAQRAIPLRSKAEAELENLLSEKMRRENPSRDLEEIRALARSVAGEWAGAGSEALQAELGRQRERQNEWEMDVDQDEREQTFYE